MKLVHAAGLVALGIALSGCATIVKGTTQSISVASTPVDGAECTLVSSEGTWHVTTPGTVVVHKTKNDIEMTCTRDGYQNVAVTIPSKFGAATAGNLILGGAIGLAVDAASGANYEYPAETMVTLAPVGASAEAPAAAPPATASGAPTS